MIKLITCLILAPVLFHSQILLAQTSERASIDWTDCPTDMPHAERLSARCGRLNVPLDYAWPDGEQADIFLAVFPAQMKKNKGSPVLLLAGGPGQAGSDVFPAWMPVLKPLRRHHDLVVIDQRGTGRSESLSCPQFEQMDIQDPDREQIRALVEACSQSLDQNPRFFTTWEAIHDLDQIRQALQTEQVILYGGSYGTRLGTAYMRYFSENTEKAILDSVVPVDEPLGSKHHINLQRTLKLLSESCAQQPACQQAFPDLMEKIMLLPGQLGESGETLAIRHPSSHVLQEYELTGDMIKGLIRLYAYSPEQIVMLPYLIDQADQGHWQTFAELGLMLTEQMHGAISMGMHNSIVCTEDFPIFPEISQSSFDQTLMGESLAETIDIICENWPRGFLHEDFHKPLDVEIPTMILAGEWDPVTPPDFAQRLAADLPVNRLFIAPGQGHIVINRGCTARLASQFLDGSSLDDLDESCLNQLSPPHFFLNANGPAAMITPDGASND